MPQDNERKAAYEHEDQVQKQMRAEAQSEHEFDDLLLRTDQHTGQQGVLSPNEDAVEASDVKAIYALLPDFTKDELRRLILVPAGTRLKTGGVYCDLRDQPRREVVARGEEIVAEQMLLVAKHDVDYEIWNKLIGS